MPSTPWEGSEGEYELSGGAQKISAKMFGSRGFRAKDDLGSGKTDFGHTGRDVGMPHGTKLSLSIPGKVIESDTGYNGGYGNFMVIKLADGRYIKSNHHSQNLLAEGDDVVPGKAFAKVGNTGLSFGAHMHLDLGTGPYYTASAKLDGLMDPDPFITSGAIFMGEGDVESKTPDTRTAGPTPPKAPETPATPPKQPTGRVATKRRSDAAAAARRKARETAPPVAPLNKKDTASALEKFGTMDEDNNQQVAVIEVPVTRTEYIPMPLPLSTAGARSVSNTPAWGQGAVLGA
jgi:hypothetical protein